MSKNEILTADAEVLPPELAPALQQGFKFVAECDHNARLSFAQGAAFMVIAGLELLQLKKEMGVKRGGARKKQSENVFTLNWKDTVEEQTDLNYRTCQNYMLMAEAAKSRLKKSDTDLLELAEQNASQLDQDDQLLLLKSVAKITDGHTAQQLMWDWGITKKPNSAKGGKTNSASNPTQTENEAWLLVGEPIANLIEASLNDDAWIRSWWDIALDDDEDTGTLGLSSLCSTLESVLNEARGILDQRVDGILRN